MKQFALMMILALMTVAMNMPAADAAAAKAKAKKKPTAQIMVIVDDIKEIRANHLEGWMKFTMGGITYIYTAPPELKLADRVNLIYMLSNIPYEGSKLVVNYRDAGQKKRTIVSMETVYDEEDLEDEF